MTTYVIDSDSLITLGQFYPSRFPTLWDYMEQLIKQDRLISVRECKEEIESYGRNDHTKIWAKNHSSIFLAATPEETAFIAEIFKIAHFRQLISQKAALQGKHVADPFLIASAKIKKATVVTQEELKPHAAKIPNVCRHFGIPYINLEQMMEKENLSF